MTDKHSTDRDTTLGFRLWATAGLNVLITCTEFVGGVFSGSVALIADAVHNLSDVLALVLAAVARFVGSRPPNLRHTYGLKRIEVLSAFLNATILLLITAFIIREAVLRLFHPSPVKMALTLLIACVALFGNIASVLLLRRHDAHDLNVRSAFLHLVQDALSSLVVVVAAALAHTRLGPYLDPIAALVVGCAVVGGIASILREAVRTLMEGTPRGIEVEEVVKQTELQFQPARLHHVHIWEVGPGQRALTAHLTVSNVELADAQSLCVQIRAFLSKRWGIQHATLQLEVGDCGQTGVLGNWRANGE
jgi:cobalt-zinc-cadmium efflux system protein